METKNDPYIECHIDYSIKHHGDRGGTDINFFGKPEEMQRHSVNIIELCKETMEDSLLIGCVVVSKPNTILPLVANVTEELKVIDKGMLVGNCESVCIIKEGLKL